ncbi:MAG: hypothetical protein NVSMB47_19470 [Polyangiales bacterium]
MRLHAPLGGLLLGLTLAGCSPSPEKVCGHLQELDDKASKGDKDKSSAKDRDKQLQSCVKDLAQLKKEDAKQYGVCSKCILDADKAERVLGCLGDCQSEKSKARDTCKSGCFKADCSTRCFESKCNDGCFDKESKCSTGCFDSQTDCQKKCNIESNDYMGCVNKCSEGSTKCADRCTSTQKSCSDGCDDQQKSCTKKCDADIDGCQKKCDDA